MKTNHPPLSGFLSPRVLIVFTLCSLGVLLTLLGLAANPPSGARSFSGNLPRESVSVDKPGGAVSGETGAPTRTPLAPGPGDGWAIVTSPNAGLTQTLDGVACASATQCWAVGYINASANSSAQ